MSQFPAICDRQRKAYPSDLSELEWGIIKPLLPAPFGFGHPRTVDLREILNAIFYVQRTGCQWEMLPHDLPPHTMVYAYFPKWQRQGLWQTIHDQLRYKLRNKLGRDEQSTLRDRRFSISKDNGKKGTGLWLRWRQEGERA